MHKRVMAQNGIEYFDGRYWRETKRGEHVGLKKIKIMKEIEGAN